MLSKFKVSNFKGFNKEIVLDFTNTKNYEFSKNCVRNGIVNKSVIYGQNGSGKSNLGFAIFDLVSHITDKQVGRKHYNHFLNAQNGSNIATFYYQFQFDNGLVEYAYGKRDKEEIIHEELKINSKVYAKIDRRESDNITINAKGAESLKRNIGESKISIVSYINNNSLLAEHKDNQAFKKFITFVNGMLFFRSVGGNNYIGLEQVSGKITSDIIKKNNIKDFEDFLNDAGIDCSLIAIGEGDNRDLAFDFDGQHIPFYDIASQGTATLAAFYFWLQRLRGDTKATLVFVDEFDAFYHHLLSKAIINQLRDIEPQVVVTTHNTSIISNDLLRPDCYFLLNSGGINSLANVTPKELREAHNIEKMYRAGTFGV